MSSVKIVTNSMEKAPKAQNHADIKGQGTIPYAKTVEEKTPNTEKATVTTGKSAAWVQPYAATRLRSVKETVMAKQGLYANIRAKRERIKQGSGETMRKVGSPGAPTKENFKQAAKTAKLSEGGEVLKKNIDGIAMRGRTKAGMCA